ncbi:MAG: hypothetical protein JXB39_11250 [Deltaproteobacteria bacterium]|nr:hypothetical protein [Deltaproteobacteria bacterium]
MRRIAEAAGGWRGEIACLVVVLVAAIARTCAPWAWDASYVFADTDAPTSTLALHHLQGLLTGRAGLDDAPLGWPFSGIFGWTDWQLGQAVATLPLRVLGLDPERVYMLGSLQGLLLTAVAFHAASRALAGPGLHNVVAALIGGFGPLQVSHAIHVNLVHHEWTVLAPLLVGLGARGRPWLAFLGGLMAGSAFHFGLYSGLHTCLAFLVVGAVLARGRALALGGVGLAIGLVTVAPVAAAHLEASTRFGFVLDPGETVATSWHPAAFLGPILGARIHVPPTPMPGADPACPGCLVLGLALLGFALARGRAWVAVALTALAAALLALGPSLAPGIPGPAALLGPNIRAPIRWLFLVHAAMALWAAVAVKALLRRLPGRAAAILLVGVVGIVLFELPHARAVPARTVAWDEAYRLVRTSKVQGPIYECFRQGCDCAGTPRLRAALVHGLPLAGARVARTSPLLKRWNQLANQWPRPSAQVLLEASGVRLVLEHPPVRENAPPGLTCRYRNRHRLCVLPERELPDVGTVSPDGSGDWVGMRWAPPLPPRVVLRCGSFEEATDTEPWAIVSEVRQGMGAPVDVFLPEPCPVPPTASVPGGVPLRLR